MERVEPWGVLVQIVAPHCPKAKTGRPPFGIETMLRIHYLQQWFGLSDPTMEEALHDVPLYREFARLDGATALVCGYEGFIDGLHLPDADDRHVLAAAIRCGASVIVTFNDKDFPAESLKPYGIEAQHPDEFVDNLFDLDAAAVVTAARRQRAQLSNPPIDVDAFLSLLLRQGLAQTVRGLSQYKAIL